MGLNSVQYETIYYKFVCFFPMTYYEQMFRMFCTEKKGPPSFGKKQENIHPDGRRSPGGLNRGFLNRLKVNLLQKMLWKVCKETGVQPSRSYLYLTRAAVVCFFLGPHGGGRWDSWILDVGHVMPLDLHVRHSG